MLSEAKSITHEHLLSIVHTESERFHNRKMIRILEVGCGNGDLIAYFCHNIFCLNPKLNFELYGFDVTDHCIDKKLTFPQDVIKKLSQNFPGVPWEKRITSIKATEPWPYLEETFDVIISNQVGEHIDDHNFFFSEIRRVLRPEGYSVHLFPLKHYIMEGHIHLPFVHRISNYNLLKNYIWMLSRLGIGDYKAQKKQGVSINRYSEEKAKYILSYTNYLSYRSILNIAKSNNLLITFRYTKEFYVRKLIQVIGLKRGYKYSTRRSKIHDFISLMILRYISSITVFLEKKHNI